VIVETSKMRFSGSGSAGRWGVNVSLLGTILVAVGCGVGVVVSPIVAAVILGVVAVMIADALPSIAVFTVVLVTRTIADGSTAGNGIAGLGQVSAISALAFVALGAGLALRRNRGLLVGAIFMGAVLLSNWYAALSYDGSVWKESTRILSIVCAFLVILNLRKPLFFTDAVAIIQVSACIPAVFAIYQFVSGTGMLVDGVRRPAGTLAHPNSAALVFGLAIAASVYLCMKRIRTRLNIAIALLLSLALGATASIGGVVTTACMILALVVMSNVSLFAKFSTALFLFSGAWFFSNSSIASSRLDEVLASDLSRTPTNSFEWRVAAWRKVLAVWREEPVFGQGLGATTTRTIGVANLPHNEYVRLITEIGLLGCLLLVLVFVWLVRKLLHNRKNAGDLGDFAALSLVFVVGFLINSFGANTFLYSVPVYMACIVVASFFACGRSESTVKAYEGGQFSNCLRDEVKR
jgi:O-antigen ligase